MLITSIPQYIQGVTNAKVDLTTTDLTTLFTVPSDADFNAAVVNSILVQKIVATQIQLLFNLLMVVIRLFCSMSKPWEPTQL